MDIFSEIIMNRDIKGKFVTENKKSEMMRVIKDEKKIMQNIRQNNGFYCLGAVKGLENDGYGQAVLIWCNGSQHLEGYDLQSSQDCVDYLNGDLQSSHSINQFDCDCLILCDKHKKYLQEHIVRNPQIKDFPFINQVKSAFYFNLKDTDKLILGSKFASCCLPSYLPIK